jgi:hypothetical protein
LMAADPSEVLPAGAAVSEKIPLFVRLRVIDIPHPAVRPFHRVHGGAPDLFRKN